MRVSIAFGRTTREVDLPSERTRVLEKNPVPPLDDPDAALRAALRDPIGTRPLAEIARGRRDATIVVSDKTRPVPNALLLPPLLDALREGGVPPEAVTVLVATGLHRPNTPAELEEMLGGELARTLRVEQHDARDADAHVDLGRTSGGIPVHLDRRILEADLKITTGLVEPHLMAGYSGGRKAVCPGLASVETIRVAHGPAMLEAEVGPGIVAGNPLHENLLEVQRRVGVDFIANLAIDRARRIAGVFCGDAEAAHVEAMAFVEEECHVSVDEPAHLVVVSGGGHPLDGTFYQSIKGISAAANIVEPGGTILLCAALSEGVGSASFEKLLRECASPHGFEMQLEDDRFFAIDQWMVQHLCQAHRRARILVYTEAFPPEGIAELLVEPVRSLDEDVAALVAALPEDGRIAVLPQGPYVLATVRGEKRPLGHGLPYA